MFKCTILELGFGLMQKQHFDLDYVLLHCHTLAVGTTHFLPSRWKVGRSERNEKCRNLKLRQVLWPAGDGGRGAIVSTKPTTNSAHRSVHCNDDVQRFADCFQQSLLSIISTQDLNLKTKCNWRLVNMHVGVFTMSALLALKTAYSLKPAVVSYVQEVCFLKNLYEWEAKCL